MSKIAPCLWFATQAEDAARFYVTLLPDSRIDTVIRSPLDIPGGSRTGDVLMVEFTLAGQSYQALNGGTAREYNEAVSVSIGCADQAEVDRLWAALEADGGRPVQCGWIRDRFGVPWQVVPRRMMDLLADPDRTQAARAMQAMFGMVKFDIAALERAVDA